MKKYLLALLLFLTGCATNSIERKSKLLYEFKIATACTEPAQDIQTVMEQDDWAGNLTRGSYAYSCGDREYACQMWFANYQYFRKCMPKI